VIRTIAAALFLICSNPHAQTPAPPAEHAIQVRLMPASGEIQINDQVMVTGRDSYRFRLAPWLGIKKLWLDGQTVSAQRQRWEYVVELPDRNQHQLDFDLFGVVPAHAEHTKSPAGGLSSGSADGVYLPAYDAWIPRDEGGRIRYRIVVSVPSSQRAVATGKLVAEQVLDDVYLATFVAEQAGEAPSLFAGPYLVNESRREDLRLRTYFHAELADLSENYLDAADSYVQRYQASIGDYPYADFHIISAPLPVGLGFPNLTYVGRKVLPLPFMRKRSLAHEVLHNWWGNGIAVDYASGNWAEGLTTYLADYALAADQGAEAASNMRVKWLRDYAALPAERDQPVRAFKSRQHQASQVIGYNKVAFIFHMLNQEIGEGAFNDGLRHFWDKHKHGTAGWQALQAAFETSAKRDLDWFFEQWLERAGAPRLSLGNHRVDRVEAGYRTSIEILQPVAGYRFKLRVLLATDQASEQRELNISDSLTRVEWITAARPESIHFDPDSDIFRRLAQDEAPPILRDITLDPAVRTIIASSDSEFIEVARDLAAILMDTEPRFVASAKRQANRQPLLLIATFDDLAEQLALLQLEMPSQLPDVAHTAVAWTARQASGAAVLVVSAKQAADLKSLLRPLPHYGGQSYVLFEAGRAVSRGIWPFKTGSLFRELSSGS